MDLLWTLLGAALVITGIVGCIIPGLPGPPLNYAALLLLQLKTEPPFSLTFLLIWAAVVILVTVVDYWIPALGTKQFGGSRQGIWGALAGAVLGIFFFPPLGILFGAALGALAGELLAGKKVPDAMRAALGAVAGFMAGTVLKLAVSLVMTGYFIASFF